MSEHDNDAAIRRTRRIALLLIGSLVATLVLLLIVGRR